MRVVHCGVEWVRGQRTLVDFEDLDQTLLESRSMVEGDSVCVGFVFGESNRVHREELGHEGNWNPKVLEKEEVKEVRLVFESEREEDLFVAKAEAEGGEHDDQLDAHHDNAFQNVTVCDVSEFMVHDG